MVTYFEMQKKKEPVNTSITQLLVIPQASDHVAIVGSFLVEVLGWSNSLSHPDIHWLNPDFKPITIEQVRDLQQQISFAAFGSGKQYFIVCNLDQASIPAQNALLKTLEEPPASVQLILTASSKSGVLPTVQSRSFVSMKAGSETEISQYDEDEIRSIYQTISTGKYSDIIDTTESRTDKASALQLLENLTVFATKQLEENPTPLLTSQLYSLQKASKYLQQNTNVRLTLESCFFAMKQASLRQ